MKRNQFITGGKWIFPLLVVFLLNLLNIQHAQAGRIYGTAPRATLSLNPALASSNPLLYSIFVGTGGPAQIQSIQDTLNQEIQTQFDQAILEANKTVEKFTLNQLSHGFANANVYASNAGTIQGYQNYDLFSVSSGFMIGVQAPSTDASYYSEIDKKIETDGDLYAGLSLGVAMFNIGIHPGWFGLKGDLPGPFDLEDLYFNLKFGTYSMNQDFGDIAMDFKTTNFGIGVNLSYMDTYTILWGLFKWRGFSIGTGFTLQKNTLIFTPKLDSITETLNTSQTVGTTNVAIAGDVTLDPSARFGLEFSTYTFPIDIVTSIQFLWLFNLTLGAGLDINFGSANIILEADGSSTFQQTQGEEYFIFDVSSASLNVDGSASSSPSLLRIRLMTGVGFNLGPVKVDIPIIYYLNSGVAIGITAGVVW